MAATAHSMIWKPTASIWRRQDSLKLRIITALFADLAISSHGWRVYGAAQTMFNLQEQIHSGKRAACKRLQRAMG